MLTLTIKKKWFDMILSGEKKEEYREIKPYYTSRFEIYSMAQALTPNNPNYILLRNGYGKDRPTIKCQIKLMQYIPNKVEWGAEPGKMYYVLKILSVEKCGDDNE